MKKKTKVSRTTKEKKEREYTKKDSDLRRHGLRLLHHLAETSRLRGRLLPPGGCRPASGLLRSAAEQALGGATLLASAPSRLRGGGARAASRCRLAARDGFGFIVVRPVVKGGSEPGAACFAAGLASARLDIVVHMDRPQVGVLQVMFGPVGDEAALRV